MNPYERTEMKVVDVVYFNFSKVSGMDSSVKIARLVRQGLQKSL